MTRIRIGTCVCLRVLPLAVMVLTLAGLNVSAAAAAFQIVPVGAGGSLMWTNVFTNGICTVEATGPLVGTIRSNAWQCQQSFFATNALGAGAASLSATQRFFRVLAVDVSAGTPVGFTNLVHS